MITEIYPAREEPLPGVSSKLVVDRLLEIRPGMAVGWAPALRDAARIAAGLTRPGSMLVTVGAGDVNEALELVREELEA